MPVIETDRLVLRRFCLDDLDAMVALNADPEFRRFLGGTKSREDIRAGLDAFIEEYDTVGYSFYATLLKPERTFIGRCGLLTQWIDGVKEVEVAYGLAPAYWGQGLATEAARAIKEYAFETLGLKRVISIVDQSNFASRRVAEKNGMTPEKEFTYKARACLFYSIQKQQAA